VCDEGIEPSVFSEQCLRGCVGQDKLTTLSTFNLQMTQMKECVATTASTNLHQSTMMQEFEVVAEQSVEPLPPGWIWIWNNPGGTIFFNTVDHNIHKDIDHVHAKVVLTVVRLTEEEEESNSESEEIIAIPDPVGYNN
jgi:hypothetical protein